MRVLKEIGLWLMVLMFFLAGFAHFARPKMFMMIVPPPLPPHSVVLLSGVCEILLAVGLALKPTRRYAAWAVIAFLVAVFPANIYMYMIKDKFPKVPEWALAARLPLQFVLMAWAYLYTKSVPRRSSAARKSTSSR